MLPPELTTYTHNLGWILNWVPKLVGHIARKYGEWGARQREDLENRIIDYLSEVGSSGIDGMWADVILKPILADVPFSVAFPVQLTGLAKFRQNLKILPYEIRHRWRMMRRYVSEAHFKEVLSKRVRERRIGYSTFTRRYQCFANQENAQAERDNTQQTRVFSETTTPVPIRVDAETHERKSVWKTIITGIEILGIAAVIYYAYVARYQWTEMIRATGAAERAVDEARRNRLQTDRVFNETVKQFHLDQRAWVSPKIEAPRVVGKPHIIKIFARNNGKTPALEAKVSATVEPVFRGGKPKFYPLKQQPWVALITPGNETWVELHPLKTQTLDEVTEKALRNGDSILYVYGRLDYCDVFRIPHWETFCYRLAPDVSGAEICPEKRPAADHNEEPSCTVTHPR